ncbi:MAG: hypothetical protein ACEQR7_06080 [Agathobacter rectalis]
MSENTAPVGEFINVGHDESTSDSTSLIARTAMIHYQCRLLKEYGFDGVRINLPSFQTQNLNIAFRDALFLYAQIAKLYGLYVVMGYRASPLNTGNFTEFKTQNRAGAIMAASYGVDEWQVGNEEDLYVGFNPTALNALRPRLQEAASEIVITDGTDIIVSTAITTNVYDAIPTLDTTGWKNDTANWISFMNLDLHIYFSVAASSQFNFYADNIVPDLGASHVYCYEYGVNGAEGNGRLSTAFANDEQWVKEEKRRDRRLLAGGVTKRAYFAYKVFDSDEWSAVRVSGNYHTTLLPELSNSRPFKKNIF